MWLIGLDEPAAADVTRTGGKAVGLTRLRALGLPTPEGFVIASDAPAELPAPDVVARARALPGDGPLVVRSSATGEDTTALPGIYLTRTQVARDAHLMAAIEDVRRSALAAPQPMAVIVQPEVPGQRITLYSRDPARGRAAAEMRIEAADATILVARDRGGIVLGQGLLDATAVATLWAAALRIEALLGAPADVEAVVAGADVVFVQARVAAMGPPIPNHSRFVAPGAPDVEWRLDAEHNPAPLSAAQAGLVAEIGAAGQAVIEGYLYVALVTSAAVPAGDAGVRFAALAARAEAALAPVEAATPTLAGALTAYREVVKAHAELRPVLRAAREALFELVRAAVPAEELPRKMAILLGGVTSAAQLRDDAMALAGRALEAGDRAPLDALLAGDLGAFAPAWDVAVPTHGEAPGPVIATARALAQGEPPAERRSRAAREASAAASAVAAALPPDQRAAFPAVLAEAREAARLGEADDAYFARAQRAVRRALLARGEALVRAGALHDPADVFELPFADTEAPAPDLAARAARARRERQRQGGLVPPLAIRGAVASYPIPRSGALRGQAGGGRARGPAFVVTDLAELGPTSGGPGRLPPEGAILVLPAVLPAFTHLISRAAGLVIDHGGLLSHGAAQAREYGLALVVGAGDATRRIGNGAEVVVDGETGWVWTT